MNKNGYKLFFLFTLLAAGLYGQQISPVPAEQDTSAPEKVIVEHANVVQGFIQDEGEIRYLKGEVSLRQGGTFLSCDTAILYVADNNVVAYGEVLIQQGDSLAVYADSLFYAGDSKVADLFGNVSLTSDSQQLFTDRLRYNLNTKIATYFTGATLTSDSTQLTSRRGYFYVNTNEAFFKDTVFVINNQFSMVCDTLKYNVKTKRATFLGPTRIDQNESKIYCESGFYDTDTRYAKLYNNAQFIKNEQIGVSDTIIYDGSAKEVIMKGNARFRENDKRAKADVIVYEEQSEITRMIGKAVYESETQFIESEYIVNDKKSNTYSTRGRSTVVDGTSILNADSISFDDEKGLGYAEGNVVWVDTAEQITIVCQQADYQKETDYILARGGRPLLITIVEEDSLFMTSDTLVSLRENPEDSLRTLLAYKDVRIFKSDLQGVCDSLVYSTGDSLFYFYQNPIIWSDTTQFTADTMQIQLVDNKIDQIFLVNRSFIINSPDEILFNQIKGRQTTAYFKDGNVRRVKVEGSAETIYFIQDDVKAYISVNKTICSEMLIYFGNNEVEDIRYYNKPTGSNIPLKKAKPSDLALEGFKWYIDKKPKSLKDLF